MRTEEDDEVESRYESTGLMESMKKTKVTLGEVRSQVQNKGKYPCVVCSKGVGRNSIHCKIRKV